MESESHKVSAAEESVVLRSLLRHHRTLQVDQIDVSSAVGEGENIMSVITKYSVRGHDVITDEEVEHLLILKRPVKGVERREMFHCDAAFSNEATFYSKVLPSLLELTPGARLPFPACLHASDDLIVLRHRAKDGFFMSDRKRGLDLPHCVLVLKELGRSYAVSYAMKHNYPVEFKNICSLVKEVFITKNFRLFDYCVDNNIRLAIKACKNLDKSTTTKLNSIKGCGLKLLSPLVAPSEPSAVICHGDFWNNNLLFRYSEDNSPTEVCFLDLQGCRYASPVLDILYFVFSSSMPEVFRNHFEELIEVYHTSMSELLSELAPGASIISLADTMDEVRSHGLYGLVMTLMVLPTVTMDGIDFDIDALSEETFKSKEFIDDALRQLLTPEYMHRVNEIISVFVEKKLI